MKGRPDREGGGNEGKDGEQADRQRYVYPQHKSSWRERMWARQAALTYENNQPCACQITFSLVPQPQSPISRNKSSGKWESLRFACI